MRIRNIERVLVWRKFRGMVSTMEDVAREYPLVPAGTLDYYDVVHENVSAFRDSIENGDADALGAKHRVVLNDLMRSLLAGDLEEMTYLFVLSPNHATTYAYVADNMDLILRLALELDGFQRAARAAGKRLNVVVRYASEMNSGTWPYAGDPTAFKSSFAEVREAFRARAPHVLFSFSPGLRADVDLAEIPRYWPGHEYVDVIGATWYVHGEHQRERGMATARKYFLDRVPAGKPFAIDEFGGALGEYEDNVYRNNDVMLEAMLHEIESLEVQNVTFKYGTIFLDDKKYGVDATLGFLG
jgi:hypothetical protein